MNKPETRKPALVRTPVPLTLETVLTEVARLLREDQAPAQPRKLAA
jgi:hypothetical protein